jgi:signal transduction histidine kinase/CheY-like chemotaxis protein
MARILVVDDDPFFLHVAEDILRGAGFTPVPVSTGREAMRVLSAEPCEVVVTDVIMPDISGLDLLRMIKRLEPLKPVICVSVLQSYTNVVEMIRGGAFDFVPKPLDPSQLVASVRAALEQYGREMEKERLVARAQGWTRELLALRTLGEATGQDLLRTLFRKTVEAVADTLGVKVASLMLLEGDELAIVDANGLPSEVIGKVRVPAGQGISGWVAQHGEPLLINDLARHPVFRPSTFAGQYQTQSALCVPLRRGDRVLGVINVNNKIDGTPFEQKDLDLLLTVANQVAMAIDNARLFHDLEEKAAELRRAHQELVRLDKDKTELILNISHELKTPLTAILGYAGLLRNMRLGGEAADFGSRIEASSQRLNHIVERMLELFRLEAGRTRCHPSWVTVSGLMGPACAVLEEEMAGRSVEMDIAEAPGPAWADGSLFRRALVLVLENALKFSPAGSPLEMGARRLAGRPPLPAWAHGAGEGSPPGRGGPAGQPASWLEFVVTDHGTGMAEKDIPLIFERFRQLGDILTEKPSGAGLGLSIARTILELHGGLIWAESTRGVGSSFHLLLPQPPAPKPADKEKGV